MAAVKHDTAVSYEISLLFCIDPHLLLRFRCGFAASASFFLRFGASARSPASALRLDGEASTREEVTAVRTEEKATSRRWKTNGARTFFAVQYASSHRDSAASQF